MKGIFCLLGIISLFCSCSSVEKKNNKVLKKAIDIKKLDRECNSRNSLSCARLGYYYQHKEKLDKSLRFYDKACSLGDENSCYNLKSLNPQNIYFKKLDSLLSFYSNNIMNCHSSNNKINAFSSTQLKEKWHKVHIRIHINQSGEADKIQIQTPLSNDFKKCVNEQIKGIKFPKPKGIDPTYTYDLTLRSLE